MPLGLKHCAKKDESGVFPRSLQALLSSIAGVGLGGLVLLWAAIYNGFPLFYADSASYLFASKYFQSMGERPVFYGLFLALARQIAATSWLVIAIQSLVTALLIRWVLAAHDLRRTNAATLAICALLASFTGISWQVGQLMADAFTPLAFLSFYLLVFRREEIGPLRSLACAITLLFSLLVHYSHWTVVLCALLGLFLFFRPARRSMRTRAPLMVLNLIFLTLPLTVAVNQMLGFSYLYSKNQYTFLVSRLLEDGSLLKFLDKNCDRRNFIFCDRREVIRHQNTVDFLWGRNNPYRSETDESARYRELLTAMIVGDPLGQAASALTASGLQLVRFRSGEGLEKSEANSKLLQTMEQVSPGEREPYARSRQQEGALPKVFARLNPIYIWAFTLSVLALAAFLWRAPAAWSRERELVVTLAFLCVSNAAICGAFSGAYDRYQSRVAWLPVFAVLVLVAKWILLPKAGRNEPPLQQVE
jgi:hypothetical protein